MEDVNSILNSAEDDFGYALRSARETKGFSINDISHQLHLDEPIIMAIENHQLDALPESAYVCGYIRNYARFVGIPAEPLIDQFKKETDIQSKLTTVNSIGNRLEKSQQTSSYLFIIFLSLFFIFAGVYGWKLWPKKATDHDVITIQETVNEELTPESNSFKKKATALNEEIKLLDEKVTNGVNQESSDVAINDNTILNSDMAAANVNTNLPDSEKAENVNLATVESTTTESVIQVSNTEITSEAMNEDNIKPMEQARDSSSEAPILTEIPKITEKKIIKKKVIKSSLKKELYLVFEKDSWISIKDGKNKSLIYDLMRKGEKIKLKGIVPIKVFLGDATGVSLSVDDESVDLAQYINEKNIAKFVVD